MKVSVHINTYNDEKNIARALKSVLEQEVNFDYEILIGDDCSSDGTRDILLGFRKEYPDRIRLLLHSKNFGDQGKTNFIRTLDACQGSYVALLPGDDYWICSSKLQKQVDFMERNLGYSGCYHDVIEVDDNEPSKTRLMVALNSKRDLGTQDLLAGNYVPTCSLMFRKDLGDYTPEWFFRIPNGDWLRTVMLASYGTIGFIDEVMSVYRKHPGGIWSTLSHEKQLEYVLLGYRLIKANWNLEFGSECLKTIHQYRQILSYAYLGKFHTAARSGNFREALPSLIKSMTYDPSRFVNPLQIAYIIKSWLLSLRL